MPGAFDSTRLQTPWTAILSAQTADPVERRAYPDYLLGLYREPTRKFILASLARADGGSRLDDADDLVQAFFLHFLENNTVDRLDPERGSFRAFLKTALRNYVATAFRQRQTRNPGGVLTRLGHHAHAPDAAAEAALPGIGQVPDPGVTDPEALFDRASAHRLVADAVETFRQQCADRRIPHYFTVFERHVWRPAEFDHPTYQDSAAALGCSEKDITNHLHRARKAFEKVLREHVRQTVATDDEVEPELAALRQWFV